jgi:hypothetical protein
MIKKGIFVLIAFAFMAAPAFADTRPEFDAVGCDVSNIFLQGFVEKMVVANTTYDPFDTTPTYINEWSDFADETFETNASQPRTDPCFGICGPAIGYESQLTSAGTNRYYQWEIVLQMQPESDINLDIRDCVMTFQGLDIWNDAAQTGRFRDADADRHFQVCHAQPLVTVRARPGWDAHPAWLESYCGYQCAPTLKARRIPGGLHRLVDLDEVPYTSKGLWQEGIIIAVPSDGDHDRDNKAMYRLREGDIIIVKIEIPSESPVDVRYGTDNVVLRYVGVVGTEFIADTKCASVVNSSYFCNNGK